MPNYCALEDAFPIPEWIDSTSYKKMELNHNDERYGSSCNIPQESIPEPRGVSSRDNGSLYNQDEYSLYKALQNKYGSVPLYHSSLESPLESRVASHGASHGASRAEGFGFPSFAANDFDRLLIILLAGMLLLTIIDYGKNV